MSGNLWMFSDKLDDEDIEIMKHDWPVGASCWPFLFHREESNMKCLRKYQWVKLPRDIPDMGKGLMAYWAMLAFRAAFRKGNASYCGHSNPVAPGMWAGGVVGLKSILGVRSRTKALQILGELSSLGFLKYSLDSQTKKLTYEITDWVVKCSGAECMSGTVYASTGYGFLCLPRNITQRLANAKRVFDEADAWLDLWCHTTYEDYGNAFSFLAPVVQYGRFGSVLTLETLGERWGWEKTKVWRFFKKHGDVFSLYRLPSSYGCLVFNASYPTGADIQLPEQEIVMRILRKILICSAYKCKGGSENLRVNHMVAWYSRAVILSQQMQPVPEISECRVSSLFFSFLFIKLTRFADLSPGGRCPVPVNLILDEFNNIGRIGGAPDGSDFCRSLSVIRSRDIRVMLAVQSLGQLQNRYPNNLWSEIIGNCDIQLMLGCTDDVTADYISDRSGEMCIVVDSTMTVKKTVAVTQVIPQYRETQGQGKRKLLTPDEVLRLPHEQMLVIIRGQYLLLLNKFDYTRHPMSKEMVRASIMDYCPRTSYAPTPQTGSENEPDKKPQRESRGRKLSRSDTPPVEF